MCGVLGHLAPVRRCARSVCGAVGCVCSVACAGRRCRAHTQSIWTAAVCSRQGLGTLRARTRPSRRRLFCSRQGLDTPPGAHSSVRTAVVRSRQGLGTLRARTRPSGRQPEFFGTCSRAMVRCVLRALSGFAAPSCRCCFPPVRVPWLRPAACLSGVPRGPACSAAPRPVWSLSGLRLAFPTPWCLSQPKGLAPPALLGGCAGHAEAGREPGSLCLALAPA